VFLKHVFSLSLRQKSDQRADKHEITYIGEDSTPLGDGQLRTSVFKVDHNPLHQVHRHALST
jgi:hypothetical protein